MKAIRVHAQGGPEVLAYEEVPRPEPGPGDVLVRVHAAGVNPPDWYARAGFPLIPAALRPTVALPMELSGRAGVDLLLHLMQRPDETGPTSRELETHLMVFAAEAARRENRVVDIRI